MLYTNIITKETKQMVYSYFGNCKNTSRIWDATQMQQFVNGCTEFEVPDYETLQGGDRNLPKCLEKDMKTRPKDFYAGYDDYQKIMFIYDFKKDIHYFFDMD